MAELGEYKLYKIKWKDIRKNFYVRFNFCHIWSNTFLVLTYFTTLLIAMTFVHQIQFTFIYYRNIQSEIIVHLQFPKTTFLNKISKTQTRSCLSIGHKKSLTSLFLVMTLTYSIVLSLNAMFCPIALQFKSLVKVCWVAAWNGCQS